MGRYLDPKSYIVFKKIFGQHPRLLKSFLNAVLPLSDDQFIVELEYLPVEQIPTIPAFKKNFVDVKCKDALGRVFIVEMQIEWTQSFMQRLLFGTAQAYVQQLEVAEQYNLLNPVYGLALVDTIFDKKTPEWYHHYGLVKLNNTKEELINGLTLVFVELPKFKVNTKEDRELKILWLRFMREITSETYEVDQALTDVPEIKEALLLAEEAGYSPAELNAYEDYWKAVRSEKTYGEGKFQEGKEEGEQERTQKITINMLKEGLSKDLIAKMTGLSLSEINQIEATFVHGTDPK